MSLLVPEPKTNGRRATNYHRVAQQPFAREVERALGCDTAQQDWEDQALIGLEMVVERLVATRGLPRWQPS